MLTIKQYSKLKKYKIYLPFDVNTNSKLYYEKDDINKILYMVTPTLEERLRYLDECNLSDLIKIKSLIFDDSKLKGYSFTNYREYSSLTKNKMRTLSLKLDDCKKIIKSFDNVARYNIKYNDFHTSKSLINLLEMFN